MWRSLQSIKEAGVSFIATHVEDKQHVWYEKQNRFVQKHLEHVNVQSISIHRLELSLRRNPYKEVCIYLQHDIVSCELIIIIQIM